MATVIRREAIGTNDGSSPDGARAERERGGPPNFPQRVTRGLAALKVVPVVGVIAWAIHGHPPSVVASTVDPNEAVVTALALQGLTTTADEVQWIDAPPRGLKETIAGSTRAVVRATRDGESQHDVYLIRARRTPEGRVVDVESVHAIAKTEVDETKPAIEGELVAFATKVPTSGVTTGVDLYDLRGEDPTPMKDWRRAWKIQNAIANYQHTGSTKGFDHRRYDLLPLASTLDMAWADGALVIEADGHKIVVDPGVDAPIEGGKYATVTRAPKSPPPDVVQWTVDRVRDVPWLGPHTVEFIEYHAFKLRDWLKMHFAKWFPSDAAGMKKDIENNVGNIASKPAFTDPEIGFPPANLTPMLKPTLEGEGEWRSLEDDLYVGKNPGLPSPFVYTFIRTDPQRAYATVYITLWDPRQVALDMVAGTTEPVSATGEVGTGQIPRTPEILTKVVAGFNGGFQAVHFEGGMEVDGTVYLPPKPYAATVSRLIDGTTAIGTWPGNLPDIPDEIISFRQNLTPLVRDDVLNPYKQIKWGGTPPGWSDAIHTTRSGICLTKDGFVAYFFATEMGQDSLGKGMLAANCKVGVHLDMNPGHTGFEFYSVAPTGELPDLGPLESSWQAEGNVPGLDGWSFRARRMIKGMPHMFFPRYIKADYRDFFYLTLRNVLPGANLVPKIAPAEEGEGVWEHKGLPQDGFPYAVVATTIRPDPKQPSLHARLVKVDPHTVRVGGETPVTDPKAIVTFGMAVTAQGNAPSLWLAPGNAFVIGASSPGAGAVALFGGADASDGAIAEATSLLATTDDGTLIAAYGDAAGSGPALKALLQQLGCSSFLVPPKGLITRFGGNLEVSGQVATAPLAGPLVTLVRGEAPGARELFPETPVVAPEIWQPLQAKRVRYFGKKPVRPGQVVPPPPAASSSTK